MDKLKEAIENIEAYAIEQNISNTKDYFNGAIERIVNRREMKKGRLMGDRDYKHLSDREYYTRLAAIDGDALVEITRLSVMQHLTDENYIIPKKLIDALIEEVS